MSDERLVVDEIAARLNAAAGTESETPAPWHENECAVWTDPGLSLTNDDEPIASAMGLLSDPHTKAVATFLAHAPNDVATLLAMLVLADMALDPMSPRVGRAVAREQFRKVMWGDE